MTLIHFEKGNSPRHEKIEPIDTLVERLRCFAPIYFCREIESLWRSYRFQRKIIHNHKTKSQKGERRDRPPNPAKINASYPSAKTYNNQEIHLTQT